MRTLTVEQAAKAGGCSKATIHKAISTGLLKSTLSDGRRRVDETREQITLIIRKHFPKSRPSRVKPRQTGDGLASLVLWARLDATKRDALIKLADKYSAEELELLLSL